MCCSCHTNSYNSINTKVFVENTAIDRKRWYIYIRFNVKELTNVAHCLLGVGKYL